MKDYQVYEVVKKRSSIFSLSLVICGIVLAISICNIFGYVFFSSGISLVSGKSRNPNNFYAVEVASFDNYDTAYEFASTLQQKGGAGYISYNKKYKVLTSMYLTYDNAKSVAENIKSDYPDACVYEIVLPDIEVPDNLTEEQSSALTTSFAVNKSTLATFSNIYLGLDKGEITDTTAISMLHTLYEDSVSQTDSIRTKFHSRDTATYLKYEMYLTDFASNIAEITKLELKGMELSQIIKYQQLKCAFLYISMAKLFN